MNISFVKHKQMKYKLTLIAAYLEKSKKKLCSYFKQVFLPYIRILIRYVLLFCSFYIIFSLCKRFCIMFWLHLMAIWLQNRMNFN